MQVDSHDFGDKELGKAVPYGIYDITANTGWVNVGTDHDTAAFAVESIRRWWNGVGHASYPGVERLLITADAGGSNGYRTRAWKTGLARTRSATYCAKRGSACRPTRRTSRASSIPIGTHSSAILTSRPAITVTPVTR